MGEDCDPDDDNDGVSDMASLTDRRRGLNEVLTSPGQIASDISFHG
jgi:hypothetical protein